MTSPRLPGRPRAPDRAERIDWLRLIRSENVGPVTVHHLLARYGTVAAALEALPDLARRGGHRRTIRLCPRSQAVAEAEALAALDDAPPVLAVRGHVHLLRRNGVAMVGARNASANGRRLARRMAADLGAAGLTVISGLARGIDAAAHQGALDAGTVAVVAGGVDVVYPEENRALHEAIVGQGVVVSEMPLGTIPQARHFPRRNRLISGLALATLVVEAALRSGSLITARLALEQGREVLAVPGSPLDPRARGCNHLIRQGAILAESAKDVLDALAGPLRGAVTEPQGPDFAPAPMLPDDEMQLAPVRRAVAELLGPTPVAVDELVRQCQVSAALIQTVVLELELAGRVERHPGNRVALLADSPRNIP
ncbi:MAG: DNA-protecting protein DprA [Alphaproteobacteria bacterium]|nr:MAG: DNA-protecting protein DprA [Alphaproteobacteria bacterium]